MDNQQSNQNQPIQPTTPNVVPQPTQAPIPPKPAISPLAKVKEAAVKITSPVYQKISSKFNTFPPQQQKLLKIAIGIFAFALVLLIVLNIIKSLRPITSKVAPTSPPTTSTSFPTPTGIGQPSAYATDSGVLKIESDTKTLETKLDGTDLEESNLKPPDINFYMNFTQ